MQYKVQLVALASLSILLAGCETPNWYAAGAANAKAKLRVVASAPGNTYIVSATDTLCPPSAFSNLVADSDRLLGIFHPGASQSFQSDRRGFNRRVSMPGGSAYLDHTYAEHFVDAGVQINVRATNVSSRGGPHDVGFCHAVGRLNLIDGKNYELLFRGNGPQCEMHLFEISQSQDRVERLPRAFSDGPRNCKFGG